MKYHRETNMWGQVSGYGAQTSMQGGRRKMLKISILKFNKISKHVKSHLNFPIVSIRYYFSPIILGESSFMTPHMGNVMEKQKLLLTGGYICIFWKMIW